MLGEAVVVPPKAERLGDLPRQEVPDADAGDPAHDLAQHEAAGDGVVGEPATGARGRRRVAEQPHHLLLVQQQLDRGVGLGDGGQARAVGEQVPDRHPLLAAHPELRDVLGDAIVDMHQPAVVEQVHQHRRDRLRGRVDAERRPGRRQHRRHAPIRGRVPRAVADGAVQDHLAAPPDAERDGGVGAGSVEPLDPAPDPIQGAGAHAHVGRGGLGAAVGGDRGEVGRH